MVKFMTDAEFIKRRSANIGQPLEKWPKADLIHEVRRLRELNSGYHDTIVKLQGIKGQVKTEEIDEALSRLSGKKK